MKSRIQKLKYNVGDRVALNIINGQIQDVGVFEESFPIEYFSIVEVRSRGILYKYTVLVPDKKYRNVWQPKVDCHTPTEWEIYKNYQDKYLYWISADSIGGLAPNLCSVCKGK